MTDTVLRFKQMLEKINRRVKDLEARPVAETTITAGSGSALDFVVVARPEGSELGTRDYYVEHFEDISQNGEWYIINVTQPNRRNPDGVGEPEWIANNRDENFVRRSGEEGSYTYEYVAPTEGSMAFFYNDRQVDIQRATTDDTFGVHESKIEAMIVYEGGRWSFLSQAWGGSNDNTVTGAFATAFGDDNEASGAYSFAAGQRNVASGSNAIALGEGNTVTRTRGVAIGVSRSYSEGGVAIGFSCEVGDRDGSATGGAVGAIAMGRETASKAHGAFAMGYRCRVNVEGAFITGRAGIINEVDTQFGIGYRSGNNPFSDLSATTDQDLIFKVKTDGRVISTGGFFKQESDGSLTEITGGSASAPEVDVIHNNINESTGGYVSNSATHQTITIPRVRLNGKTHIYVKQAYVNTRTSTTARWITHATPVETFRTAATATITERLGYPDNGNLATLTAANGTSDLTYNSGGSDNIAGRIWVA